MENKFNYSVTIRTLATADEKYEKLLYSIMKQTIKPDKIIIVLPKGHTPPKTIIGIEEFVFSQKGMVPQRLAALNYINSDYTLFCDDDVEFSPEYVQRISDALLNYGYSAAAGPLLSFFPARNLVCILGSVVGEASVMLHGRKNTYVKILNTGGFSYNDSIDLNKHKIYKTDSFPGTCFMASTKAMKDVLMEDEMWLEKNGFAAWEDRVMISKLIINGYRACVVSDAKYVHNDGKTSVKKLKLEPIYARGFNHYVYWYRFLYKTSSSPVKRAWLKVCITYYKVMFKLYLSLRIAVKQSQKEEKKAWTDGFNAAKKYVKTDEYKSINEPIVNKI